MSAGAAQARLREEIERSLEKLEKENLRGLQAQSHLCAAKCCENVTSSKNEVEHCMSKCFLQVQQIQEYTGKELEGFKGRLQRCAQQCEDTVRDSLGPDTTQADLTKHQAKLDACVEQCCVTHIELVPKMFERMQAIISQVSQQQSKR